MEFSELLKRWNGGIENGAQTAFSKKLGINQSTVARWASGKAFPDERMLPRVAKALGVSVAEITEAIKAGAQARHQNVEYEPAEEVPLRGQAVKEPPGIPGGAMALLIGRIDQLTKQVADVQERCGALDHQIKEMREKMATREPQAEGTPHESGGQRKKN